MNDLQATSVDRRRRSGAFTLVELLVVIGIIALLISILIPVASSVRTAGRVADTQSLIRAIDAAAQVYYGDHQAYPGIAPDRMLGPGKPLQIIQPSGAGTLQTIKVKAPAGYANDGDNVIGLTGSENLVLSLLGGLRPDPPNNQVVFDPAAVGRGPAKLGGRSPGTYSPYLEVRDVSLSTHQIGDSDVGLAGASATDQSGQLKWGRFVDDLAAANDSVVPEFVDRFSSPLPILYLRAIPVGRITETTIGADDGRIIATDDDTIPGVFDQRQIAAYVAPNGGNSIGIGKAPKLDYMTNGSVATPAVPSAAAYYHGLQFAASNANAGSTTDLRATLDKGVGGATYPYDIRAYLTSPNAVGARQGDRYVLISAGKDRVYGTEDDLTNFGSVLP